jgi:hypothetical protein
MIAVGRDPQPLPSQAALQECRDFTGAGAGKQGSPTVWPGCVQFGSGVTPSTDVFDLATLGDAAT